MTVHELFPYLCVRDATHAVAFYCDVFGANKLFHLDEPGGRVGHVELDFGGTTLMLCEEYPEYGIRAPDPAAGTSVTLHIHVDDADALIERAVAAGATLLRPATDAFYGERSGVIATRLDTAGTPATASRRSRRRRCSGVMTTSGTPAD